MKPKSVPVHETGASPDIVLVRCRTLTDSTSGGGKYDGQTNPPFGVLYIQSYLRKFGVNAVVMDRYDDRYIDLTTQEFVETIHNLKPRFVGFSALTSQSPDAAELAGYSRRIHADVPVIVGGVHFSSLPADSLKLSDYVVIGDGEIATLEILQGKHRPGVVNGQPISVDDVPFPTKDDFDSTGYRADLAHFLCLYCAPGFLGHGLRENLMSKEVAGMVQSRRVQGAGSARTEGARRATGVGADAAAAGARASATGQRWSASRKRDVVLRLLCSESLDAVSRAVGVEIYRLEAWKARALAGLELGLKEQAGESVAAVLDAAKRHIGELSMENELLRERARAAGACAVPKAGCWPGAPRADARTVGCAAFGGHSQRPGPLTVPGRGPSPGPRAAADSRRDPRVPDAGVACDARAGAALTPPRAAG